MASFAFTTANGLPLVMTADGITSGGYVFHPKKNDVVFGLTGNYHFTFDSQKNATLHLTNMRGLIGDNKANNYTSFYFDTVWAQQHNRCIGISLDAGLTKAPHGAWREGNEYWHHDLTSWKGGYGVGGRDYFVYYAYNNVEPKCAGYGGDGKRHGSAKLLPDQSFYLGRIPSDAKYFWIGAHLNVDVTGWTQWQRFEVPIVYLSAPKLSLTDKHTDICYNVIDVDFAAENTDSRATGAGVWKLEVATDSGFNNIVVRRNAQANGNKIDIKKVGLNSNTHYWARIRLIVNDRMSSDWTSMDFYTPNVPAADYGVPGIDDGECYRLQHGMLVGNGLTTPGRRI